MTVLLPTTVEAQARCAPGAVTQFDMVGVYANENITAQLYPCGGSALYWTNAYGEHTAIYGAVSKVPGEGVVCRVLPASIEMLDAAEVIGFKAAERGFIQVFTVDRFGNIVGVYRLQKIR
jgi:hypothetical protein